MKNLNFLMILLYSMPLLADGPMCVYPKNICDETEPEVISSVMSLVNKVKGGEKPEPEEVFEKGSDMYEFNKNDSAWMRENKAREKRNQEREKAFEKAASDFSINTVDQFISALPSDMKKNFVMMAPSRSNQDGSITNPKMILKSPNSEVLASFNSHSEQRGFDEVELMVWNKKDQKYDMISVALDESGKKKVSLNPASCMNCHGTPARPQWDHPPMWAGQIPFAADTLLPDSYDKKMYIKQLQQIEAAKLENPKKTPYSQRMSLLEPTLTSQIALDHVGTGPAANLEIPHEDGTNPVNCNKGREQASKHNGSGFKMFDQMQLKTFCQINNELKQRPDWNNLKYAFYGVMKGCKIANMTPPAFQDNMKTYFQSQGYKAEGMNQLGSELQSQKVLMRNRVKKERTARQEWDFEENFKTTGDTNFRAETEFTKWSLVGGNILRHADDNSLKQVSELRQILEPVGVNMKNWSMSLDPAPYTFGDNFAEIINMGAFEDVKAEFGENPDCAKLEEKAKEKMGENLVIKESQDIIISCATNGTKDLSLNGQLNELSTLPMAVLREKAQAALSSCVACHETYAKQDGLPLIKLSDLNVFEAEMKSSEFKTNTILESMVDRISRPVNSPGYMPPPPALQPLSEEERKTVLQYLRQVKENTGFAAKEKPVEGSKEKNGSNNGLKQDFK